MIHNKKGLESEGKDSSQGSLVLLFVSVCTVPRDHAVLRGHGKVTGCSMDEPS